MGEEEEKVLKKTPFIKTKRPIQFVLSLPNIIYRI